jgi:hypothetical protein
MLYCTELYFTFLYRALLHCAVLYSTEYTIRSGLHQKRRCVGPCLVGVLGLVFRTIKCRWTQEEIKRPSAVNIMFPVFYIILYNSWWNEHCKRVNMVYQWPFLIVAAWKYNLQSWWLKIQFSNQQACMGGSFGFLWWHHQAVNWLIDQYKESSKPLCQ